MYDVVKDGLIGLKISYLEICSLMWLRTIVNCQYKYGCDIKETLRMLNNEGGIKRYYRGFTLTIIYLPLLRFGDMSCNSYFQNNYKNYCISLGMLAKVNDSESDNKSTVD